MLQRFSEILCLCCLVLCGTPASAQSAVAIEQEPAHRLVLQNQQVRVFDVWLPPGKESLWQVHRHADQGHGHLLQAGARTDGRRLVHDFGPPRKRRTRDAHVLDHHR